MAKVDNNAIFRIVLIVLAAFVLFALVSYYNSKQMLRLLNKHKDNADAVRFIADMLETGDSENDGFAEMLRKNHHDSAAIARIIQICNT